MARKTVKVSTLLDVVNNYLLNSADYDIAGREAMILMLENILIDTDNYAGFTYLTTNNMIKSSNGTTCGVFIVDNKCIFENTDHTRVRYLSIHE